MNIPGLPPAQGLYHPQHEHDACGIGFVAHIKGHKSHDLIEKGLLVLENLLHRGAQGCDPCSGDGAGILSQIPHQFFQRVAGRNRYSIAFGWRLWRGYGVLASASKGARAM